MRRFLLVLTCLVLLIGCKKAQAPTSGTGTEPYVESSYSYGKPTTKKVSAPANSVKIGNYVYAAVEGTSGFSVVQYDPEMYTVVRQENYTETDSSVLALSGPRISNISGDTFMVTLRAVRSTGETQETFRVSTSPLRISR